MLVANDVRLDSRVQKAAYSAAEAGYDVLLLGYEPSRKGRPSRPAYIGAAQVVRTGLHNKWQIAQWPLKDDGAPSLRKKLADQAALIETVHGTGYRLRRS